MKDPVHAAEIVAAVAKASHVPVTVKMRLGFETGSETYLLLGQLVQESGAQMITLHARTRSQFYEDMPIGAPSPNSSGAYPSPLSATAT